MCRRKTKVEASACDCAGLPVFILFAYLFVFSFEHSIIYTSTSPFELGSKFFLSVCLFLFSIVKVLKKIIDSNKLVFLVWLIQEVIK